MMRSLPIHLAAVAIVSLAAATLRAQASADTVAIRIIPECLMLEEMNELLYVGYQLQEPASSAITLRLRFGGSATQGVDYHLYDTTVVIPKGETLGSLFGNLLGDDLIEGTELIEVEATIVAGPARFRDGRLARLFILDDEKPPHNVLADPGFEEEPTAWRMESTGGLISTDRMRSGARALLLEESNQFARSVYQDVDVSPGTTYLFQMYRSAIGIDTVAPVAEIIWLDHEGVEIGRSLLAMVTVSASPEWTLLSGCVDSPDGARTARFRLFLATVEDNAGELWFDDLALYSGEVPSDVRVTNGVPERLDLSMVDGPTDRRSD